MKRKWYVGRTKDKRMVPFNASSLPTADSHGHVYVYAIGPFVTKRGAIFCSKNCFGPVLQTVVEFERAAKQ